MGLLQEALLPAGEKCFYENVCGSALARFLRPAISSSVSETTELRKGKWSQLELGGTEAAR